MKEWRKSTMTMMTLTKTCHTFLMTMTMTMKLLMRMRILKQRVDALRVADWIAFVAFVWHWATRKSSKGDAERAWRRLMNSDHWDQWRPCSDEGHTQSHT